MRTTVCALVYSVSFQNTTLSTYDRHARCDPSKDMIQSLFHKNKICFLNQDFFKDSFFATLHKNSRAKLTHAQNRLRKAFYTLTQLRY